MKARELLAALEPLTHRERVLRIVELGRRPDAAGVLDELGASEDPYARALALYAAPLSPSPARLLAALEDRSASVRLRAARLLVHLRDDAAIARGLGVLRGRRLLRGVITRLRARRRIAAIDAFLAQRLAAQTRPDPQSADLLPYASAPLVLQHLALLREAGGPAAWARLAKVHPEIAAREALARLAAGAAADPRGRWRLISLLEPLAESAPDRALSLLAALFETDESPFGLARFLLRRLVARRPAETFDVLRARHESARPMPAPGAFGVVAFTPVAHRLGIERLLYLVEEAPSTLADGAESRRWFLRLSLGDREALVAAWLRRGRHAWGAFLLRYVDPQGADAALREAAFQRWVHAAGGANGVVGPSPIGATFHPLDALPLDLREREARRHLFENAYLASRPQERLAYARFLSFADARGLLGERLAHPDAAERALALRALIGTVRHEGEALASVLDFVHARRFEQDRVRLAMLESLGQLRVGRFGAEHLPALGVVLADALDAADLSGATAQRAEQIVVRLFRREPGWAAEWLAKLFQARGMPSSSGIGLALTPAEVRALAPHVEALARAWTTRERAAAVLWLAHGFSRRLALLPGLGAALIRLAEELPFVHVAGAALAILRRHNRAWFGRAVPELLALDPSFAILPAVARFLSGRRQDLLGPFLEDRPMTGRFASGKSAWVIDFERGHGTWTSAQQSLHGRALERLLKDAERDVPSCIGAIQSLHKLGWCPADTVVRLASDPRPPVRETAVRALAHVDDRTVAVTALLQCLGDDRGRWAIYALRGVFGELGEEEVLGYLRAAPMNKVTVAKEVVRLRGELRSESALEELYALEAAELHRDVRVALVRALWEHLDRERTWEALGRAAAHPDWVVASKLAELPTDRLSEASEERLAELLAAVLRRPEVDARLAVLSRATYASVRDRGRALFGALLERVGSGRENETAAALRAVLFRMQEGEVGATTARLTKLLPDWPALVSALEVVSGALTPWAGKPTRAVGRELLLAALARDPLATPQAVALAGAALEAPELAAFLAQLAEQGRLHVDAMVAALAAVQRAVQPEVLEQAWADSPDERLQRLALEALKASAAKAGGWTAERRARLAGFERSRSALVAGAAAFVLLPAP